MIGRLFGGLRRLDESSAPVRPIVRRAEPATLLIVDDNADDLRALTLALANAGYRLETATSAALARWKLSGSAYDLIALNARMLDADGNRFSRHVLSDERLSAVPVAALGENGTGARGRMGHGGTFDGVISRPFDAPGVPEQVRGFLTAACAISGDWEVPVPFAFHLHQDRRQDGLKLLEAIEAGLPDSQFSANTPAALRQLMTGVRGLQQFELSDYVRRAAELSQARTARARMRFQLLIRLCRDLLLLGPDSIPELANLRIGYLEKRGAELDRLEFALEAGEYETLATSGHNLKGTGAAYGFGELTDLGRALEAAAKSEDEAALSDLLGRMQAYVSAARPFA